MVQYERVFARANAWTFQIPQVKTLLDKYVGNGEGWIDPFSGYNSPAQYTNDMHPDRPTMYHMEAVDFCKEVLPFLARYKLLNGVLFDPPYSYRQVSEHYKECGKKATSMDTSSNFTNRVREASYMYIKPGGIAITFGWNTNGYGLKRGFEIIDGLVIAHGSSHNDTLVTVERKVNGVLP